MELKQCKKCSCMKFIDEDKLICIRCRNEETKMMKQQGRYRGIFFCCSVTDNNEMISGFIKGETIKILKLKAKENGLNLYGKIFRICNPNLY